MAWYNSSWQYRQSITITGSTGAGTNYQVPLNIGESSGATGYNFQLNGHSAKFPSAKNDGGDLIFTASDGTTLLNFWVESVTGTSPNRVAKVWVKVSADLGSNQTIYCYYGNTNATNASNGDNTFIFFDDFNSTSIDWTNKWQSTSQSTYSISSGILVVPPPPSYDYTKLINSKNKYGPGIAFESLVRGDDTNTQAHFDFETSAATFSEKDELILDWANQYLRIGLNGTGSSVSYTRDTTNYYRMKYFLASSGSSKGEIWLNNTLKHSYTGTSAYSSAYISYTNSGTGNTLVDWIFVRKYISSEPAFSSAGSEERLPTFSFFLFFNN